KAWVNRFSQWAHHEYAERGVQVMVLCPGFVRTEFHARMEVSRGSAPGFMWLDAGDLVRAALEDFDRGRSMSIPSRRYKLIVAASRVVPTALLHRAQALGRR